MNENNILVVNAGSTSVKYKLFNFKGKVILEDSFKNKDIKAKKKEDAFLRKIKSLVKNDKLKIAFRVVHGGDIEGPVILDEEILKRIKEFKIFAPIHNKIVLKKITKLKKFFLKDFSESFFWAVFDTDFHKTIPKEFYTYPINQEIAEKYKIRKYGFHGIAVESVLNLTERGFIKRELEMPKKIIFAHLGGGSSVTAVLDKKSIANSMGLTPISGLMMTTRVGDVDSDLDLILSIKMQRPLNWVSDLLSRKSGFLGLTDSADTKDIFDKAKKEYEENKGEFVKEKLAFDVYLNQLIQKISAYAGLMNGLDLLVFSGGIGDGNSFLRKKVMERLSFLGINKEKILAFESEEEKLIFEKTWKK